MQFRSGYNPHEPTDNNTNSRCWIFIIRNASFPYLPRAWEPHINFCAWISTTLPNGRYLSRGVFQTVTPRNYYTLKTRYCKKAEWIKIQLTDERRISEFTQRVLPRNSVRYHFGYQVIPGQNNPVHTIPMHRIGYNIPDYPDLTEDYEYAEYARIDSQVPATDVVDDAYPDYDEDPDIDENVLPEGHYYYNSRGRVSYVFNPSNVSRNNNDFYQ